MRNSINDINRKSKVLENRFKLSAMSMLFQQTNRKFLWCLYPKRHISTVKTYEDALECLNSLQTNYKAIQEFKSNSNNVRKTNQAIDEMKEYMRRLGYSNNLNELDKLNCIHITGTKGKGSTAAFTHSILKAYNNTVHFPNDKLKIGLYTSPHLKTCRERIRINGEPISKDMFTKYFFQVWDTLNSTESNPIEYPDLRDHKKPGYFKFLTLLSFHVFVKENCTTCIMEVGIGGKYDSTNIIPNPTSTGLSLLGIDHVNVLGHTLKEICSNKIGIFKKSANNFTIFNQPEQKEMFSAMNARLKEIKCDSKLNIVPTFEELKHVELGINGDFQIVNASLATALSINHLQKINKGSFEAINKPTETESGLLWDSELQVPSFIKKGLHDCKWEGRCQIIPSGNVTWFLDGAHTMDSIKQSADWFAQQQVKRGSTKTKRILLFNQQSRDENLKDFLKYVYLSLKSQQFKFDEIIFSTNKTWAEGYNADLVSMNVSKEQVDSMAVQKKLKSLWLTENDSSAKILLFESIEASYHHIKQQAGNAEVFVTGSLHLVGGLLVVMDGKKSP